METQSCLTELAQIIRAISVLLIYASLLSTTTKLSILHNISKLLFSILVTAYRDSQTELIQTEHIQKKLLFQKCFPRLVLSIEKKC